MVDEVAQVSNNNLLDFVIKKLNLKNDAALADTLKRRPPEISRIRHGNLGIPASMLIQIHEMADMSFTEIRAMLAPEKKSKADAQSKTA